MDTSSGPLFKKMLIFSLPIIAVSMLQLLFNAADMITVGRFSGKEALAAVGATGALISLIVNTFMGLTVGTVVIVAQHYGAGKIDDLSDSVHTSMAISIISGFVVMILGLVFCKPMLTLMGTPDDILELSVLYMRIYFLGVPAMMVYNFGAAILRAVGDSRRPMYYLVISGAANVFLNLFFVIELHMSVDGVAWATVISQYICMVLVVICLMRSDGGIRFMPKQMRIDGNKLKEIVRIGLPAGLQSLLFSVSNVMIQSAVNSFGSVMVAASSAASNVEGFVATPMGAYYNAAITFTGQNMGAKKYDRIDKIAKICTALIFATWFIISGAIMIFGKPLSLYSSEPEVIKLGMLRMEIMMVTYFLRHYECVPGAEPRYGLLHAANDMHTGWSVPDANRLVADSLCLVPHRGCAFTCYPVTWSLAGLGQVGIFLYARRRIRKNAEHVDGPGKNVLYSR